ncbi:hypothetical protein ACPA9J_24925 [Pseudomonas aeruginosa]
MAVELEFYLLDRERDSDSRPLPALQMNGQRPRRPRSVASTSWSSCSHSSVGLYAACEARACRRARRFPEYAPGQVEITLQHRFSHAPGDRRRRALQARLVKGVANRRGLQACLLWPSRFADLPAAACTCTSA